MLKINFEADIHDDGVVEIPEKYRKQLFGKHIKLVALVDDEKSDKNEAKFSDEYIEKHWSEMIQQGLSHYNDDYYKSEQYYLDRGK